MNSKEIIANIKNLRIQGAENIAKAAVSLILSESQKISIKKLNILKQALASSRPTEPCLQNSLKYIFQESRTSGEIQRKCRLVQKHFHHSGDNISEIGSKKIVNRMGVFTHCHSSTVINILKSARKKNKKFEVYCTETRPLFQGRSTAKDLAKSKIPTTQFVDSGAALALKKADLCLLGSDAMSSEGEVVNKIGSYSIALLCNRFDIPLYICTNSWKFDPKTLHGNKIRIEERASNEVWKNAPRGVKISNYAFEMLKPELITGIISEIGIYKPGVFIEELKHHYPWMFQK